MDDIEGKAIRERVKAAWVGRADALGLKGKKRDEMCLHFLAGVRIGLGGNDDAPTAIDGTMFMVSLTGTKALERTDV